MGPEGLRYVAQTNEKGKDLQWGVMVGALVTTEVAQGSQIPTQILLN